MIDYEQERMHRKSNLGSFVPWETFFITEQASLLRRGGDISFLPCHLQEAAWIAGKQSSSGRWNFCQKGDVIDYAMGSNSTLSQEDNRKRHQESTRADFEAVKKESLRVHRSKLEYDVSRLEKKLNEELELRSAFENAHDHPVEVIRNLPSHLPISAQKLLLDVATLEFAVSKLEQQIDSLQDQLLQERESERESVQVRTKEISTSTSMEIVTRQLTCLSPGPLSPPHMNPVVLSSSPEPVKGSFDRLSSGASTETQLDDATRCSSSEDISPLGCSWRKSSDEESDWKFKGELKVHREMQLIAVPDDYEEPAAAAFKDEFRWHSPNSLSEQMVQCMMDIYHHLSESSASRSRLLGEMPSPTSPFAHLVSSSMSSISDSSFVSLGRSPLVDLRSKGGAPAEDFIDPYQTDERMTLPDLGAYRGAVEVHWISVGKSQLNYAAQALKEFKSLVEHLARVDPSTLRHAEKIAFWINVYNALMMHAFLAYGTPDSESRYFTLMHKASYVIGGYPLNAIAIKYALLRHRVSTYQPQLELVLALRELRLGEQELKFGLTRFEPLTEFALSFGAWSCPAVRVYTVETIHEQLQASLRDYTRASVGVSYKSGKLLIPKLLYFHVRETDGDDASVIDWISEHLSSSQSALLHSLLQQQRHQKKKSGSLIQVLPFNFQFRYLFLSDGF